MRHSIGWWSCLQRSTILLLALVVCVCAGCPPPGGPVAHYDPLGFKTTLPFPWDFYTVPDPASPTGLRVNLELYHVPFSPMITAGELNELDGFPLNPLIAVQFTFEVDPLSLPAGFAESLEPESSVFLLDFDPSSPGFGERKPVRAVFEPVGVTPPLPILPRAFNLFIEPAFPLEPSTRYAVVITKVARGMSGLPVEPSPVFAEVMGDGPIPPELEKTRIILHDLADFIEVQSPALPREEIAIAFTLTTHSAGVAERDLGVIRDRLVAYAEIESPPHQLDPPESGADAGYAHIDTILTGIFLTYEFRGVCGDFEHDLISGEPVEQGTFDLEVLLTLPAGAAETPAPVIIFGHGMNCRKEDLYGVADAYAAGGYATIGIDVVEHGSRASVPLPPDFPIQGLGFFDLKNFSNIRDNFRQTYVDHVQLVRFIEALDYLDVVPFDPAGPPHGDGRPDLDTTRILFSGSSLGGTIGPAIAAIEPGILAGVFSDGAGYISRITMDSAYGQLAIAAAAMIGVDMTELVELFCMVQMLMEPADPLAYAPRLLDPGPGEAARSWIMTESMGDVTIPNYCTDVTMRAAGVPLLDPYQEPIYGVPIHTLPVEGNIMTPAGPATAGLFQLTITHGAFLWSEAGQLQTLTFFDTIIAGGVGIIIDPYASR